MPSDKNVLRAASGLIAALLVAGCGPEKAGSDAFSNDRARSSGEVREPRSYGMDDLNSGDLDLGQDWLMAGGGESGRLPVSPQTTGLPGNRTSAWTVLLGTYTSIDHAQSAVTMASQVARIDPRLTAAWVHTTGKGSMVVYGAFDDVESAEAQDSLAWIKGLTINNRRVFPRASLARVRATHQRAYKPYELMSIRTRYPNLSPLYTVQVAAWGDYGRDGSISLEEIRRRAEAYARQLRSTGLPAFVHHDDGLRLSMVTIGIFDQSAIDTQSGINAPEVEAILRKFSDHLVNGEPLREYINPKQPSLGTRVQPSRLVLVPDL